MADDDWLELDTVKKVAAVVEVKPVPATAFIPEQAKTVRPQVLRDPPPSVLQTTDGVAFFVVRGSQAAISNAIENSAWEFPSNSKFEAAINFMFLARPHVILIFVSNEIRGYARMRSLATARKRNRERTEIEVTWFRKFSLDFSEIETLRNSFSSNRPVKNAADGEELAPAAGRAICRLLDKFSFNQDPVEYKPERELLPVAKRNLRRRFEDLDELKLASCGFDQYQAIAATAKTLPSRRFRKL